MKETPADRKALQAPFAGGSHPEINGRAVYFFAARGPGVTKNREDRAEEMNRAGTLEVLMPARSSPKSGSKPDDTKRAKMCCSKCEIVPEEWVLGPTHEEVITTLVAGEVNSCPANAEEFLSDQVKFRDEIRPGSNSCGPRSSS